LLSPLNNVITRWVENPWTRGPGDPVHSLNSSSLSEGFSMPMIWASIKAMHAYTFHAHWIWLIKLLVRHNFNYNGINSVKLKRENSYIWSWTIGMESPSWVLRPLMTCSYTSSLGRSFNGLVITSPFTCYSSDFSPSRARPGQAIALHSFCALFCIVE